MSANTEVFRAVFNQWNNTYNSDPSPVKLYFGSSSAFWPSPDSVDPVISTARGLYYNGLSQSLLPPFKELSSRVALAPSHSFDMWVRPNDVTIEQVLAHKFVDGTLIEFKIIDSTLKLVINLMSTAEGTTSFAIIDGPAIVSKQWQWVAYRVEYVASSRTSTITLNVNSQVITKQFTSSIFLDLTTGTAESFAIGSKYADATYGTGLVGFLASINVRNAATPLSYNSTLCLRQGFCLANCDFDMYPDSTGACQSCQTTCTTGCANAQTCVLNRDPKCATTINFDLCSSCISSSYLDAQRCFCPDNASYDSTTKSCACSSGFTLTNGYCSKCGNFYKTAELSAAFSEDYLSVFFDFARAVTDSCPNNCTSIFYLDSLNKFGKNPTCRWVSNTKLQVILGQGYTLTSEVVIIDPQTVQANGTECTLNIEKLTPTVKNLFDKPIPTAVISAPTTYSLGCSSTDLGISGETSIGTGLTYIWSAQANPAVSAITTFINSQTGPKFKIPVTSLSATNVTITLTVTNAQLQSHKTVSSVLIQTAYALQVNVDAGSNPIISQSLAYQFKAMVGQFCGNSTAVNYKWNYVRSSTGAPTIDSTSILANSKLSYILSINANQLSAGNWYIFNATASDGFAQG